MTQKDSEALAERGKRAIEEHLQNAVSILQAEDKLTEITVRTYINIQGHATRVGQTEVIPDGDSCRIRTAHDLATYTTGELYLIASAALALYMGAVNETIRKKEEE